MARKTKPRTDAARLAVAKTYKLYIGGKFPRTESGRYYKITDKRGATIANACHGSRKDLREAVVAARAAAAGWRNASAYLRAQIIYRIAELLEGRKAQFVEQLVSLGATPKAATTEVDTSIDRLVYFAGWCDKLTQVFGSINPVASAHYNFSTLEPTGVVGIVAPQDSALLGLVSVVAPVIAGGNTGVVLAHHANPLCAIDLCEVLHASDVPGGVVNVLTGHVEEIVPHMAKHKDINGLVHSLEPGAVRTSLERDAALNIKRVAHRGDADWRSWSCDNPYVITDMQEVKTTWHPVGL
ncbi:MAG: aldehyde dehydrogenase family protein [Gammaproteobacteria bacterium]